jgi:hypothetical protein
MHEHSTWDKRTRRDKHKVSRGSIWEGEEACLVCTLAPKDTEAGEVHRVARDVRENIIHCQYL